MEELFGILIVGLSFFVVFSIPAPYIAQAYRVAADEAKEFDYKKIYLEILPIVALLSLFGSLMMGSEAGAAFFTVIICVIATGPLWINNGCAIIGVGIFLVLSLMAFVGG